MAAEPRPMRPRREEMQRDRDQQDGMVPMARMVRKAHLTAVQGAAEPLPTPFPSLVHRGLMAGIVLGAAAGLLVAYLLFNSIVTIPGGEGLFSMGPFTFHFFWMGMGIAAGIALVGTAAIMAASPKPGAANEDDREDAP